jgi:hypothetical protein
MHKGLNLCPHPLHETDIRRCYDMVYHPERKNMRDIHAPEQRGQHRDPRVKTHAPSLTIAHSEDLLHLPEERCNGVFVFEEVAVLGTGVVPCGRCAKCGTELLELIQEVATRDVGFW